MRKGRREEEKKKFTLGNPFSLLSFIHPTNPTEHHHTPDTVLSAGEQDRHDLCPVGFTYQHGRQAL